MPSISLFFVIYPAPTEIHTLSLHDALPISIPSAGRGRIARQQQRRGTRARHFAARRRSDALEQSERHSRVAARSEEHTSELQSHSDLVCRLLLEKKKKTTPS